MVPGGPSERMLCFCARVLICVCSDVGDVDVDQPVTGSNPGCIAPLDF